MKNNKFIKRISALSILGVLGVSVLSGSLNTFAANNYIGVEKAKSIALKDAGVSGATFVKAKLDTEDGVKVYDVEFYKGNVEYDYEIDAITGKILEKDRDIENYTIPKKKATTNKQTTTKAKAKSKAKTSTKKVAKDIGVEKAKSIALKDAGVSGVKFTKAKVDYENGVKVYDIEFRKGNKEYDYEIEAATGKIRERNVDLDD
jgi:peptidase propeptide and YPEB domain protein